MFIPHPGKMLRQGRLRQVDIPGEIANGSLAMFGKPAQDHQAAGIADRLQNLRDLIRFRLERREVHGRFEHCRTYNFSNC